MTGIEGKYTTPPPEPSDRRGSLPLRDLRGAVKVQKPGRLFAASLSCRISKRRALLTLALGVLLLALASQSQAQQGRTSEPGAAVERPVQAAVDAARFTQRARGTS